MQNIIYAVIGVLFSVMAMYKVAPSVDKYIQSYKVDSLIEKEKQIYDATKRYIQNTGSIPSDIGTLVTAGYITSDVTTDNGWGQPITITTTSTKANGQIIINTNIPNGYAKEIYLKNYKRTFATANPSGDDTTASFVLPIDVLHGNSGGVLSGAVASATAPTEPLTKYWYDTSDTSKGAILKVKDDVGNWVAIAGGSMLPKVSSTNTVTATASLPTTGVDDGDIRYVYNSGTSAVDTYVYYGTGWQKYLGGGTTTTTSTCYGQYYTCTDITTNGLVAYYPLTGTADDWKNTFNGIENASVVYANDSTKGAVASFNGSAKYIDLNINDAVTGTLSFWMYNAESITASSNGEIVGMPNRKDSYNWIGLGSLSGSVTNETLSFLTYDNNSYWYLKDTIPSGWNHIVTFWNGSAWEIYLNGVSKTVYTSGTQANATLDPIFGRRDYDTSNTFNGSLSNVRVYNRALSTSEIATIYDEESKAHPIAVDSGLIAYYPLKRNSHDNYYNQYNGTDSGGFVYDGKSASFDGTNDSIHTVVNLSNSAFTVSFWTKDLSKDLYTIASSSGSTKSGLIILPTGTQGNINFRLQNTSTDYFNFSALLDKTTWQHIVMSFDNSTNANGAKIYINGVLKSQATATGLNNFAHSYTIDFMKDPSSTSYYQGGKLSDVRFYNKAITADDVKSIYEIEKKDFQ